MFTLEITFFVLVIFLLGFLTFKNSLALKKNIGETAELEVVKNKFAAVQQVYREIFHNTTEFNMSVQGSGLFFLHPMLPSLALFDSQTAGFESYMSTAMPEIVMSKRFTPTNLSLLWQNSTGSFHHYRLFQGAARIISVDYDPEVTLYDFRVYSPDGNGTPVFTRITPGFVNVSVAVIGQGDFLAQTSKFVNPASVATDSAVSIGGFSNVVNISISSNKLRFSDFLGNPGNLTVRTHIKTTAQEVYLPSRIAVLENKAAKNATPRVY